MFMKKPFADFSIRLLSYANITLDQFHPSNFMNETVGVVRCQESRKLHE